LLYAQDAVLEAYENYRKDKHFVMVGCSFLQKGDINFAVNSVLSTVMNAPMLLVHSYSDMHTPLSCFQDIALCKRDLDEHYSTVQLSGVFINRVPMGTYDEVCHELRKKMGTSVRLMGMAPEDPKLTTMTLDTVVKDIGAQVVFGEEMVAHMDVEGTHIASGNLQTALEHAMSHPNCLFVTDPSRPEMLLGLMLALQVPMFPQCSLNVHLMFPQCPLNVPSMFLKQVPCAND
jgi:BioD-like phosphotransacetylase family protein